MALNFNGVEPTAIKYNGTDLTVLKYGTTAVWGKPFSLTIQAGANSTVTVNRTSSPNQHANTGAVTSGGIVYYGDTLTITATPASGYKLSSFTINGTEYASGQTSAVSQTITVTSAVSVIISTESAASWRTVWTGSEYVSATRVRTGSQYAVGFGYLGEATSEKSIISSAYPTKITYTTSSSIIPETKEVTGSDIELVSFSGVSNGNISAKIGTNNVVIFTTTVYGDKPNTIVRVTEKVTLTEVKQYY